MLTASRLIIVLYGLLVASSPVTGVRDISTQQQRQIEAAEQFELRRRTLLEKRAPNVNNVTFTNPKASRKLLPSHSRWHA